MKRGAVGRVRRKPAESGSIQRIVAAALALDSYSQACPSASDDRLSKNQKDPKYS